MAVDGQIGAVGLGDVFEKYSSDPQPQVGVRTVDWSKSPRPSRPVRRNFRFPENEFWNLPLKIAFLPAKGDFSRSEWPERLQRGFFRGFRML